MFFYASIKKVIFHHKVLIYPEQFCNIPPVLKQMIIHYITTKHKKETIRQCSTENLYKEHQKY